MDPLSNPRIQEIGSYVAENLLHHVVVHGESDGDFHLYLAPLFFFKNLRQPFVVPQDYPKQSWRLKNKMLGIV